MCRQSLGVLVATLTLSFPACNTQVGMPSCPLGRLRPSQTPSTDQAFTQGPWAPQWRARSTSLMGRDSPQWHPGRSREGRWDAS